MSLPLSPLELHPAAQLLPRLDPASRQALREDMQRNGLLDPITLHQGKVLEGWERYCLGRELGIALRFVEWSGQCGTPEAFVLSRNVARRQLSKGQRGILAVAALPALEAAAYERKRCTSRPRDGAGEVQASLPGPRQARDDAARLFQVSPRYVQSAKQLVTSGRDDLVDRVRSGELSLCGALRQLHSDQPAAPTQTQEQEAAEAPASGGDALDQRRELSPVTELGEGIREVLSILTSLLPRRHELSPELQAVFDELLSLINQAHALVFRIELKNDLYARVHALRGTP